MCLPALDELVEHPCYVGSGVVHVVGVGSGANAHLGMCAVGGQYYKGWIGAGVSIVRRAQVPLVQPERAADIVAATIGADPMAHAQIARMRKLLIGYGLGRFELGRRQRVGSVVGLGFYPVVKIGEETVQKLAGRIAHREQLDGSDDLLLERVARLQEVQKIAGDERAEGMRDDDDLVIAATVDGILERVDVTERGHVSLKDAGTGWGIARRVPQIGVDVEDDAQNHASTAGQTGQDDRGGEHFGINNRQCPGLQRIQPVPQPLQSHWVKRGEVEEKNPGGRSKKDGAPQ